MSSSSFSLFENFDFDDNEAFQAGWKTIENIIDPEKREAELLRAKAFFFSKHVCQIDFNKYLLWKESMAGAKHPTLISSDTQFSVMSKDGVDHSSNGKKSRFSSQFSECAEDKEVENVDVEINSETNRCSSQPALSNRLLEEQRNSQVIKVEPSEMQKPSDSLRTEPSEMQKPSDSLTTEPSELQKPSDSLRNTVVNKESSAHRVCDYENIGIENEVKELSLSDIAELIQKNMPIPGVVALDIAPTNGDPTPSVMGRKSKPWENHSTDTDGQSVVPCLTGLTLDDHS